MYFMYVVHNIIDYNKHYVHMNLHRIWQLEWTLVLHKYLRLRRCKRTATVPVHDKALTSYAKREKWLVFKNLIKSPEMYLLRQIYFFLYD